MGAIDNSANDMEDQHPLLRNENHDGSSAVARLLREEVRAVVREEFLATASASSHQAAPAPASESEPAPPSYDSSARLLADEHVELQATDAARLLGTDVSEDNAAGSEKTWIQHLPIWFRVVLGIIPFLGVFGSVIAISASGRDKLGLAMAAFFLVIAMWGVTFMFAVFSSFVPETASKKPNNTTTSDAAAQEEASTSPSTPPSPTRAKQQDNFFFTTVLSWHFFIMYMAFGLLLWGWFLGQARAPFARVELAARFDAKFRTHDALSRLTTCLWDDLPKRNATSKDVTACLKTMGVY
ncbi:hypothetical protein B0H63DRAFT_488703 [Podospora didyma]|uniref:Uncharacterized protein n=1 Tax=Podospora didyma TaxID=330526 RepID=A0AAE0N2J8_9PEZI|nr:hypothetical protein B0H63DRAFT_488703 [Podospora didyma]